MPRPWTVGPVSGGIKRVRKRCWLEWVVLLSHPYFQGSPWRNQSTGLGGFRLEEGSRTDTVRMAIQFQLYHGCFQGFPWRNYEKRCATSASASREQRKKRGRSGGNRAFRQRRYGGAERNSIPWPQRVGAWGATPSIDSYAAYTIGCSRGGSVDAECQKPGRFGVFVKRGG
jgi:hypothetical protein